MLVPSVLFGSAEEVRSNVRRLLTRLRRGEKLQQLLQASATVDLAREPNSLVWINSTWVLRPKDARDFRAAELTKQLFDNERLSFEASNAVREDSVDYLALSPWGTALLNSGQVGVWRTALPLRPCRPSRRAYVALLAGTLKHWEAIVALGARYYAGGGESTTFPGALPSYGGALAELGIDVQGEGVAWRNIQDICDSALIERLRSDDDFWSDFVKKRKQHAGTPDLVHDNLAEIRRLCEAGSWDPTHWAFLQAECGSQVMAELVEKLEQLPDPNRVLGVYVHALGDMERATALFLKHQSEDPVLRWAAEKVAKHLAPTDPERAAALLIDSANSTASSGKRWYPTALRALLLAKEILGFEGAERWRHHLNHFKSINARRKPLLELIKKHGLS